MKFYKILLIRTTIYSTAIPGILFSVFITSRAIVQKSSFTSVFYSEEFQQFLQSADFKFAILYVFATAFIISFTLQVSRKMGQRVFTSFALGKYYQPQKTEKLFLFLRLSNSAEIIDKNGQLKFHYLIKELTYLLADPILVYNGVIHHYVDEDVVIYWDIQAGIKNANAIRCFHEFKALANERRDAFYKEYGILPVFHGAIHMGEVIQGEIGEVKSEIAFYGDVMNTTARILSASQDSGFDLLVSEEIKEAVALPKIWNWKNYGKIHLKGKTTDSNLYSILPATLPKGVPL